jgi:hypothetical protein
MAASPRLARWPTTFGKCLLKARLIAQRELRQFLAGEIDVLPCSGDRERQLIIAELDHHTIGHGESKWLTPLALAVYNAHRVSRWIFPDTPRGGHRHRISVKPGAHLR